MTKSGSADQYGCQDTKAFNMSRMDTPRMDAKKEDAPGVLLEALRILAGHSDVKNVWTPCKHVWKGPHLLSGSRTSTHCVTLCDRFV